MGRLRNRTKVGDGRQFDTRGKRHKKSNGQYASRTKILGDEDLPAKARRAVNECRA